MDIETMLVLAEKIARDLNDMSDDALRASARRMAAPFMYELAMRGQAYTLSASDFVSMRSRPHPVH